MKLLGYGWQEMLEGFFDHTATFYKPTKKQDSTGQMSEGYEKVESLENIPCAVSNRNLAKTSNTQSSYGSEETEVKILISGAHPEIEIKWKAVLDHMDSEPYVVQERTPSQSEDVCEVLVSRWH